MRRNGINAWNFQEKRLYYVDIGANTINNMKYTATFPNTMQNYDVDGTEGIAVDWIGQWVATR